MHSNKERLGCLWPHGEIDCISEWHGLPRDRAITRSVGAAGRLKSQSSIEKVLRVGAARTEPGLPAGLLRAWPLWERTAQRLWPRTPIPGARYGILCVHFTTYNESPVVLDDGARIEPGAAVAQLHCNNLRILQFAREGASLLTAARDDLRCLAKWIAESDKGAEIAALYGVTLLGPICTRIGFAVRPRQLTMRNRLDTFFLKGLLLLYNRTGLSRKLPVDRRAVQVWMSREELLQRYNQTAGAHQCQFPIKMPGITKAGFNGIL
jgi:hypothetical protein